MTSPQARKGSTYERAVVEFLQANGFPFVERAYGAGRPGDVGDLDGVPGWTLELKNHRQHDLAGWSDEAEHERVNGRQRYGAVIAKRRGKDVSKSYVILTLDAFARLLADDELES